MELGNGEMEERRNYKMGELGNCGTENQGTWGIGEFRNEAMREYEKERTKRMGRMIYE